MGKDTGISWCDHTANFWWGCMRVSDGCVNCYAEQLATVRHKKPIWGAPKTTNRERKKAIWKDLVKWDEAAGEAGTRRRVFVSSMSDFLEDHPQVTDWRIEAMELIETLKNLDVLLLTKRPENAPRFLHRWMGINWPRHVWFGVSVENQKAVDRVDWLSSNPAPVHFVSVEPMLERIDFSVPVHAHGAPAIEFIDWMIVGGESGPGARPFEWNWARDLLNQCDRGERRERVAFWMKQGGGVMHPAHLIEDLPADLRIRELPTV